ncbi:MAG: TIGR03943 family protein [Anaerolineae bacterium]|nr:TIGR03943 family protein [Anaerolineae bacterium]
MQLTESLHDHEHDHHDHEGHDHSRENQQQVLRVVILLGLAAYFGYNILSGNLTNYINERFAWLSYLAVGLFGIMGLTGLLSLLRGGHLHQHDHDDHEHTSIGWGIMAIVAIPLLLGVLLPSKPLGAEAVDGNISSAPLTFGAANVLTKEPLQRNVLDWLRVFSKSETFTTFNDDQADVSGFIYREPGYPKDTFMVARFTVSCCVADASAIGLPVYLEASDVLETGGWVRVTGAFKAQEFGGKQAPVLIAATVEEIEQPQHPYLYP